MSLEHERGLKISKLPVSRSLVGLDLSAQSSLDPPRNRELATWRYVANRKNVLLLGPPGVARSHLAICSPATGMPRICGPGLVPRAPDTDPDQIFYVSNALTYGPIAVFLAFWRTMAYRNPPKPGCSRTARKKGPHPK
jgi:hypothetical protein